MDLSLDQTRVRSAAHSLATRALLEGEREVMLMVLDEARSGVVTAALQHCGGNQTLAAQRLGIALNTLRRYMRRYGIGLKHGR